MEWALIKKMADYLQELEYNVANMSISQITELYVKLKTEEKE